MPVLPGSAGNAVQIMLATSYVAHHSHDVRQMPAGNAAEMPPVRLLDLVILVPAPICVSVVIAPYALTLAHPDAVQRLSALVETVQYAL